jgi:hypothetical protein
VHARIVDVWDRNIVGNLKIKLVTIE